MQNAPWFDHADPFAAVARPIDEPDPVRAAMRALGPVVRVPAPAGGTAWIVTEETVAREVFGHPDIAKDPAFAPPEWDPAVAGLEQTAAEQPSLTTLDGPPHTELRRAHAPLFTARRIAAQSDRVHAIARDLLTDLAAAPEVDLMAGFTTRFPLIVLLDLLGIPLRHLDEAASACRRMSAAEPGSQGAAIATISALAGSGLTESGGGLAVELRERAPAGTSSAELRYHLFGVIFAGQLTTDAALGFLVARLLADGPPTSGEHPFEPLVRETLRRHPPAPYSLWRFTTTDTELAGIPLPARSPVLVDIEGINTDPGRTVGPDLAFGGGPHFCVGAQLAQLELRAVAAVLSADFPGARLAIPFDELRQVSAGGIQGARLTALPVVLHG